VSGRGAAYVTPALRSAAGSPPFLTLSPKALFERHVPRAHANEILGNCRSVIWVVAFPIL
jgi:hypothetical protein